MKLSAREWLNKADEDYTVALRESKADPVFYNIVTYHAQQASEKMLKAYLQEFDIKFMKTHSLLKLLEPVKAADAFLISFQKDFAFIDDLTPDVRYPGPGVSEADAKRALEITGKLKEYIEEKLK